MKEVFDSLKDAIFHKKQNSPNELRTIRILKASEAAASSTQDKKWHLPFTKSKKINNFANNSIKTSRV